MTPVSVNDLQPGMTLGNDAIHDNGRVLLRKGVVLEQKHIKMLKVWGLISVEIEGITQEELEHEALNELDPGILEAVRKELAELFCHNDLTQPVTGELYRLLVRQRARQRNRNHNSELDG